MNDEIKTIPYVVYEMDKERSHNVIKRLITALIISVVLAVSVPFAVNAYWLHWLSDYDIATQEYDYQQDGTGTNIIGSGNSLK